MRTSSMLLQMAWNKVTPALLARSVATWEISTSFLSCMQCNVNGVLLFLCDGPMHETTRCAYIYRCMAAWDHQVPTGSCKTYNLSKTNIWRTCYCGGTVDSLAQYYHCVCYMPYDKIRWRRFCEDFGTTLGPVVSCIHAALTRMLCNHLWQTYYIPYVPDTSRFKYKLNCKFLGKIKVAWC